MPVDGFDRRRFLVAGAALAGAMVLPGVARADADVVEQLSRLEADNDALIGLYAADLASGRSLAHRADERFAMCSTFKAYAAGRVLQMVDAGAVSLEQSVMVDPARVVANSPITGPRAGTAMTLAELCKAALQHSDNTAANLLLSTIGGPPAITAFARSLGDEQTRLDRWEPELNSVVPGDMRDTSTPAGLAAGFRTMLIGDALSPGRRDQLTEWMRANQTSSMRAGLPAGWTCADKTGGGIDGIANDIGVLYGPDGGRMVLAVMIDSRSVDAAAMRPLIGQIAALVVPA